MKGAIYGKAMELQRNWEVSSAGRLLSVVTRGV